MTHSSPLYGKTTKLAIDNFPISGTPIPYSLIESFIWIKRCAAQANASLGEMDQEKADGIVKACDELLSGDYCDEFPVDIYQTGSGTSTNMNVNEVIASLASVHPNDDVNKGQSSNDTFPSAIHISAALRLKDLMCALEKFQNALEQKADEWKGTVKIGRTHLQDAVPMTLGQEFSGYADQVCACIERLKGVLNEMTILPIGGTAVGTGINTHKDFGKTVCKLLSDNLDISFVEAKNHFSAQASKDSCVQTSGTLKTTAVALKKIANDIRWMGSGPRCGLGELNLPELQPGSSIMPGKVNPVLCESVLQVCARVIGNDATVTECANLSNFELNVGMPLMGTCLLESIDLLTNVLDVFTDKCIVGLKANTEKLKENAERSLMLATSLAPIVGYDEATSIAKEAYKKNASIREIALERGIEKEVLDKALTPENLL